MSMLSILIISIIVAIFLIGGIVALCLYFSTKNGQKQTYGMYGREYLMDNDQNMNQNEQQAPQYQQNQYQQQYQGQQYQQATPQYQQPVQQYQQYQQNQYQQQYQGQQYQGQQYQQQYQMGPILKTDRSIAKFILFSIITCGIYAIFFYTGIADDINRVATPRDGKKTMHYCLMTFVLAPLTCGIFGLYWWHTISDRIGEEARARGIYTDFSSTTFWLWQLVGVVLCGIGPFIYVHKLCQVMNQINNSYNQYGR